MESPQRSEDLQRIARPRCCRFRAGAAGTRPNSLYFRTLAFHLHKLSRSMPTRSFFFPFDRTFLLPIVALLLLLFPIGAFAQPGGYSSSDKGAIKRYEAGLECMRMRKWECA